MNYTLNQLRIFLKIVEKQSVTLASEELHLTQPAVSIQLKNFQDQFEIPLTEVVGRKIYVTDFGREIAEAAKQIIQQVDTISYKTLAYKGRLFGKIKISVVSTGKYVMPYFLTDFLRLNPGVELEMDVTNKNKVVKSLENNEVDFALVSLLPEKLNVNTIELLPNKLFFVSNNEESFKGKTSIEKILKNKPLLFREVGSGTRLTMQRYIEQNNVKIEKKMELTSNEAVKQAILAGLGYSIMPLIGIQKEIQNNDLKIVPLKGLPIKTNWNLIWMKGKNHSPAALAYMEYLQKNKDQIINNRFSWYDNFN